MTHPIQAAYVQLTCQYPAPFSSAAFQGALKAFFESTVDDFAQTEGEEANPLFTPILPSCFTKDGASFVGSTKEAYDALCTAAILHSMTKTVWRDKGDINGLAVLTLDAKGWCNCMMNCSIPTGRVGPEWDLLLQAKGLVGSILLDAFPMEPRSYAPVSKEDILEGEFDS